jgi:hypothetical protein
MRLSCGIQPSIQVTDARRNRCWLDVDDSSIRAKYGQGELVSLQASHHQLEAVGPGPGSEESILSRRAR